mgnify:FL=1|jgi:signal transduction histidine kinase
MRNPLNSIIAFNLEKKHLYRQLKALVTTHASKLPREFQAEFIEIIDQLDESRKSQEASAKIMTFLVQDLLDYAQLKSGKFRKNISKFNIMKTVQKVIKIQEQKALKKGIRLFANFENIGADFSPWVMSDEHRIMQVLLNL